MNPDLRAAVREVPGGVELSVFCQPKAARSALIGMHGGALKAKVKAPPVEGRANRALLDLLSGALGVPRGRVKLVSGEQSRNKRVRVEGVDAESALAAILVALDPLAGSSRDARHEDPKIPPR
ncbi:MAG TPA: DUF167 domain-containing protein [Actinomycetota bacterium]|nr:DUF167 domain-containing protein [Actinomycetota bacterium]